MNANSRTHRLKPVPPLILRMHLVDGFNGAGAVTDSARFSQRGGVREHVRSRRQIDMTPRTGRAHGLVRIDRTLRIDHRIEASGQVLLTAVDVAERTVPCVRGFARWTQGGEQRPAEVVVAAAETDYDVGSIEGLHVDSVVNPMNQQVEV